MAHDLRSPITRIRGIAEMTITSAKDNYDYELMAGSIVEECDRLLGIINMILDISEAKAGLSKLNISQIDVSRIMDETCELFRRWPRIKTFVSSRILLKMQLIMPTIRSFKGWPPTSWTTH